MKTWMEIEDIYFHEQHPAAKTMLRLVRRLRQHPDLMFVYRSVAAETETTLDALVLWLPNTNQLVHVLGDASGNYQLYSEYHEQRQVVDSDLVIPAIIERLRRGVKT